MLLKYRVISGTIWNSISSGFSFFLNIGTIAVLARLLKPEEFGLFAMINVVINILDSFSDMGASGAVISYRDVTSKELSSLFYFNIFVGVGLSALMVIASPLIVFYFKEPRIYMYLWILALNFTLTSPATLFNVLLKKEMKFKILSRIMIIGNIVYSVSAVLYALLFGGIMALVVGTVLQGLVFSAMNIHYGLKLWKPEKIKIKYAYIKRFLSFGLYQMGERIINRFNWNIDYLLVGRFLGAEALGFYSVAYNLMLKPISKINPIITSVAFPAFSEIQDDNTQLKKYFLKMIRYICYIMAPIYLLFFVLSEQLILFFYGDKWLLAVPVFAIFSFLGFMYSLGNPVGSLILAKGRADLGFWMNVAQTIFLFVANYIGVRWGITGVAFSTLFVTFVLFFPMGFWLRHYLARIGVGEYLNQIKKSILFASIAMGSVFLLEKHVISANVFAELAIFSVIFMIIYLALLWLFDKKEILYVKDTMKDYLIKRKSPEEPVEAN